MMLTWTMSFMVLTLVAAVVAFGGVAGTAIGVAKLLFLIFLMMTALGFFAYYFRGKAM